MHTNILGATIGFACAVLLAGTCAAQTFDDPASAAASPVFADGLYAFNSSGYSIPGPALSCNYFGSDINDVWLSYYAQATATVVFTVCPTSIVSGGSISPNDSSMAVWDDFGGAPNVQLSCEDGGGSCGIVESQITLGVTAGHVYYVQIGNWFNSAVISGNLAIGIPSTAGPGDICAMAFTRTGPGVVALTATTNSAGGSSSCAGGPDVGDQWVAYTALTNGLAFAATCPTSVKAPGGNNAGIATYIAVFSGCPAGPSTDIACSIGGGGCSAGNGSEVGWIVTAGTTYYVQCGNGSTFQPFSGASIAFNELPAPGSVFTDDCLSVNFVSEGVYTYDTSGYALAGPSASCTLGAPDAKDGWLAYMPSSSGIATFSNCSNSTLAPGGATFLHRDTYIAVWDAATCPPTLQLVCGDGALSCFSGESETSVAVTSGSTYFVQVGSRSNSNAVRGNMAIALYVPPPPAGPGDDCTVAVPATIGGVTPYNSAGYTTPGQGSPCNILGGYDAFDYWMSFVAPASGTVIASNCPTSTLAPGGSAIPNLSYISAWDGAACPPTTHLNCNAYAPSCGNYAEVQFSVAAGQAYYIQVGQWQSSGPSSGTISLTLVPPPTNDECSTATPITTGLTLGHNIGASASFPQGSCGLGADPDVWYAWTSTCAGTMVVDTCGSSLDTWVAVWDSCPGLGVQIGCNDQALKGPCPLTHQSYLEAPVTAGQTYFINVGGRGGNQSTFALRVSCKYAHEWSVPAGPGSIRLENVDGPANAVAFSAVTFDFLHTVLVPAANFPNGWFFGVPMDYDELVQQLTVFAPVFLLTLDAAGYVSNFSLPAGTTNGLTGATLWSVGVALDPATGFTTVADVTDPTAFTL